MNNALIIAIDRVGRLKTARWRDALLMEQAGAKTSQQTSSKPAPTVNNQSRKPKLVGGASKSMGNLS